MAYFPGGALPWLPAGASELPAERHIILADTGNLVQLLNESAKTLNGTSFSGVWLSQTLNRKDPSRLYTLQLVILYYAAQTSHDIVVKASGDGGKTFSTPKQVTLDATLGGQISQVAVDIRVSGADLRMQVEFSSDETPNWFGFQPVLVERGKVLHAVRS